MDALISEIVEHQFSDNEFSKLQVNFSKINHELVKQKKCICAEFNHELWVIFFRIPELSDITWLTYEIPKNNFKIGTYFNEIRVSELLNFSQTSKQSSDERSNNEVIDLVSETILYAYKSNASDIHFENDTNQLTIKNRIDGVLIQYKKINNKNITEQIISRLKVLADLDISERRVPQDGRLSVHIDQQDIDLRISIMPGLHGEDAVLRILDKKSLTKSQSKLSLEILGFDAESSKKIRKLTQQPYGMVLVTGPTGSGKTTTLYALLQEQHNDQQKLITIEDPVEYQMSGTLQIPVNERKGLTFAKGLRSILRHDPDTILIGEIRDKETAEIAVQAALTGHLVYSSVHANHALDVIGRFKHMEIDLFGFLNSLNGIIAQRLIRLNCEKCSKLVEINDTILMLSGLSLDELKKYNLSEGIGCEHCQWTGYRGRKAIAEILVMNDDIKEDLLKGISLSQIKQKLINEKMVFLRKQALAVVASGLSTFQEINRVTFVE
ncbi:secretion system protein E [Acinetobacter sp. Root1280]|uniref:GspE/PulE family protein n=1 Tax=Acinetobacter sp. Root1280 TaxID=1736444 RepID=UPI0006F602EC|nr:GspE/PulE family protein [Acinetobacter sp. Root1280]KQW99764.1 secretion system protein E [Acinetobacter sp. Root1280]